jgi:uncharacterized protein (TIGR03067 family)
MVRILGAAVLLAALAVQPPGYSQDRKTGAASLVGNYVIVAGEVEGKTDPPERIQGSTVHFSADRITVKDKDTKEVYVASYTVDTSHKPWHIHMKSVKAPVVGQESHGLVQVEGDTVKLIYGTNAKDLPREFKTRKGENMFILKRTGK